jgi:glucose/arabinose dehydrogenase
VNPRVRVLATLVAAASVVLAVLLVSRIEPTPRAPSSPRTATPRSASPSASTSPGASSSGSNLSSSPVPSVDLSTVRIALKTVATGLDSPVFAGNAGDGSGRLFVLEQAGLIRVVENGKVESPPFLDIRSRIASGGERGLLGLAFHPGYGTSGEFRFYVDYTDLNGDTVIAEYRAGVGGDPNRADPGTERVLLHIKQPFANHNGGGTVFGRGGFLYVGMGDGGSGGDPMGNGQRLDTLLGKLLRIDVDHPSSGAPYGIPDDNPFIGGESDRPEIWAYGLRNPWRFSFDRATGDLWIGDVGQNRFEEVDRATQGDGFGRGADYGWNIMEGAHCYPSGNACDKTPYVLPVTEYDHSGGNCAVIGGYVYRGSQFPAMSGGYVFGDECSGDIRLLSSTAKAGAGSRVVLDSGKVISSFGEDEAGELYMTALRSGELLQVTAR